ncbi:MAG TPA: 30S ribosomal protein S20 [Gemmataceae bacterium]|jgi:small subunit ribosomal protein S20|nr:30S ribosomal protein S20 [Gemmataceae bacterium]
MPHTKSAKKSLRQDQKRRDRNRAVKKALKTELKKFQTAVKAGDTETAKKEFVAVVKKLDKAAARKVIHPNKAARAKSQLARQLAPKPAAK